MIDEVKKTVINNTEYSLTVIDKGLPWGRWVKHPSSTISKVDEIHKIASILSILITLISHYL